MIDLVKTEHQILSGLKDFQRATVDRVYELFINGASRVLVGDEVGLGKTLVARGTIARVARYHKEVLQDDLFKVVYICSNQSIASQNIKKLKINKSVKIDKISETRLSMQHLKIFKDNFDSEKANNYIQLIPITPTTSFNMTRGSGIVDERALTFSILKRCNIFEKYINELEELLKAGAKGWDDWAKDYFESEVVKCDINSKNTYLKTIIEKIEEYFQLNENICTETFEVLKKIKINNGVVAGIDGTSRIVQKLRKAMAEISIEFMNPDLVIMDEFQKFKELIDIEDDSETSILARKFLKSKDEELGKVKILLLSATPYKLYSTIEEINESGDDDHYKEFMQVVDFLHEESEEDRINFRKAWGQYSKALNNVTDESFTDLIDKKKEAENQLYKGICRTERMVVQGANNILDINNANNNVKVTEEDIMSFVEMNNLLEDINLKENVPVEYIKSAPYIMSFMDHYKLKEKIFHYFSENNNEIDKANRNRIWINKRKISKYKKIPMGNGRLEKLKEEALSKNAEKLLWIPPAKPYYEFMGAYIGQEDFSKVLVFSSWEMVPRSIAAMISYEAERLTVGKIFNDLPSEGRIGKSYFRGESRFLTPRILFKLKDGNPIAMNSLCLLYPSITLAKSFNSIQVVNTGLNYRDLRNELQIKIKGLLNDITNKCSFNGSSVEDKRWYYIAPLLFDRNELVLKEFFEVLGNTINDTSGLITHFEKLKDIYENIENLELGKRPSDLVNILCDMVLGSPTIAMLRVFGDYSKESLMNAVNVGKVMIDKFNTQEATAIVELQYGKKSDDVHWKNVLKYCRDGNIQAMFDEYAHILIGANDLGNDKIVERNNNLAEIFISTLKVQTASYNVDTFEYFRSRALKEEKSKTVRMRSSYAVGFYDTSNTDKTVQRKDSIRESFNSPFRPFVLATTSIGQEGLDFHNYCRKIVHWNLPSNPVDIEQREGRINRYKCFAIRKNIAKRCTDIKFKQNIWEEMFIKASEELKGEEDSELIPFWCIRECEAHKIKRIVPAYPFSKEVVKYERLMKILNLYRLSLGQARQEDLMEYILDKDFDRDKVKELFMNLSPYYRRDS